MEDLLAVMKERGLSQKDLAERLSRRGLGSVSALKSKLSRFLTEDKEEQVRTVELANELVGLLGGKADAGRAELLPFVFRADKREVARAMRDAATNPDRLQRDLAAGKLIDLLESGEFRLDQLIGGHSASVESRDEVRDLRRRRRGADAREKAAPSKR